MVQVRSGRYSTFEPEMWLWLCFGHLFQKINAHSQQIAERVILLFNAASGRVWHLGVFCICQSERERSEMIDKRKIEIEIQVVARSANARRSWHCSKNKEKTRY
jgi:hypothetical protein